MPEEFLRLLLGGVGWGLGTLFAGQGDTYQQPKTKRAPNEPGKPLFACEWPNCLFWGKRAKRYITTPSPATLHITMMTIEIKDGQESFSSRGGARPKL